MTLQEPAWLKRTRPCPFFSQGRCLFADSCNFLHDVTVKNAVTQSQPSTVPVKQPSIPPRPVFDPPSVVVNSASPRSDNLATLEGPASPIQDSSRYSGLLSVLSDVIGPPSNPPVQTEQGTSGHAEPASVYEPDSEDTLVESLATRIESFFPEVVGELVAQFMPVPGDEVLAVRDTTSYLVEDIETYVVESGVEEGDGDRDVDDPEDGDPTMMMPDRQSTLSSFTGASLLASPQNSFFGKSSVTAPIEEGAADLLSPVQLSAKLQLFPIPSSRSKVKRGDSIDSGYADGDSWVSPLPFSRSPPRGFRSSTAFLSHSRRLSHSSPVLQDRRTSYDVGVLRASSYNPIEVIKEVEPDESSEDDEDDIACAILGAYDTSPSEEQGEVDGWDRLQVKVAVVAEEKAEEDDEASQVPTVAPNFRWSPERLHPTRECDLDPCNQFSFVSDDNLSFKTALSTQPSYDNLSDIPARNATLLPSISGRSTPNTSILSHYSDAIEFLDQPIVNPHVRESSCLVATAGTESQVDSARVSEAKSPEECSQLEEVPVDVNKKFPVASADGLHGLALEKVVPRRPLPDASHFDGRSPISAPSVDTSHSPSSTKDILGYVPFGAGHSQELVSGKVVTPPERSFGASHLDERFLKSSPSAGPSSVGNGFCSVPSTDNLQEFTPETAVALRGRLPGILHHDPRSSKSSPSTESSYSSSSCQEALCYVAAAVDVREFGLQKRLSSVSHYAQGSPKHTSLADILRSPFSIEDVSGDAFSGASEFQEDIPWNVVAQGCMPGVLHFNKPRPKSSPPAKRSHNPSSAQDAWEDAPPYVDCNESRSLELSPTVLQGHFTECATAEKPQSLDVEKRLWPDEITESADSGCANLARRLSFPLPLPFLPGELTGHSTLSAEDTSVLSEAAGKNREGDALNACTAMQHGEAQRICSGSALAEKARVRQLPPVQSPGSGVNFTLRRSRAASDLTVKGRSPPVPTPGDTHVLRSSPLPLEQPGRSDSVQSLYEQYFDDSDGASDEDSEFSDPAHQVMAPLDVSGSSRDARLQYADHVSHVVHKASSPFSDSKASNSGTDSPRSETVLCPLLARRASLQCPSLAELVPKANPANAKQLSSPTHPSTRLQVREFGSTMVPLGFRRHRHQPAATQSSRCVSEPLRPVSRGSEPREVLRIRTDVVEKGSPPGCSSATYVSSAMWSPVPAKPMSAPPIGGGLKQLHLSSIINKRSSTVSTRSSSIASSIMSIDRIFNSSTPQSPSVSSTTSLSHDSLFSSPLERVPGQVQHTLKRSSSNSLVLQAADDACPASQSLTCHESRSISAPIQQPKSWRLSQYRAGSRNYTSADSTHRFPRRSSLLSLSYVADEQQEIDQHDSTTPRLIQSERVDDWTCPASDLATLVHAIATPKPTLLFAIASDNVDQVRQVLESGEAGPNDSVGPQSALAFTLTNDKLAHKQEIVKALLAYGANPSALRNPTLNSAPHIEGDGPNALPPETTLEGMDPATRYFVARADATHTRQTSQLIYRSCFRPLTRVRYDVIGQDWALEQLFRILNIHSKKLTVAPIVVLLCGPSGHGKSLLARRFGSLLDVPTHTVNMTTLRSAHDIWQSYSMSPYEEPSSCTLAEFLTENEGNRCVVVLDEIEKVEDQKALWSLLMPWELGRCSLEAGKRHVDARDVIWLGTSNVGHELVFEHHKDRTEPDERMSREEYHGLADILRPRVSHCLGASLLSRVTAVLPFVPFTLDEQKAIAAEAVYAFSGDASKMSPQDVESLVMKALPSYHPSEGARSLHRAISNLLADAT